VFGDGQTAVVSRILHDGIGTLEYNMFLRFWCVTLWTLGHFLLFCLIETLVFRPIPPMPVEVIDYLERPLLVKSRSVLILPYLTCCQLHVELSPITIAVYPGTVLRACLQVLRVIPCLPALCYKCPWYGSHL
jgi:hypothetical protein